MVFPYRETHQMTLDDWEEDVARRPKVQGPEISPHAQYSKEKYAECVALRAEVREITREFNPELAHRVLDLPPYEEWRRDGLKSLNAYTFTDETIDLIKDLHRPILAIFIFIIVVTTFITVMVCMKYNIIQFI